MGAAPRQWPLALGRAFVRWGLRTVVAATSLTACFAPLVFPDGAVPAVIGVVLWGLGAAVQESVVRAAVTGMVGPDRRASAFGRFDTGFGAGREVCAAPTWSRVDQAPSAYAGCLPRRSAGHMMSAPSASVTGLTATAA
ncbi:hypothetical protein [Streptomyces sp. NPDC001292]|uniref:hypothetical protein n=1 Tax=Streptomyces sp. NPDC001292 TaxID=3364558 RepID=UPI0036898C76